MISGDQYKCESVQIITRGIPNPISIRNILEKICRYFIMPLDDEECGQLMTTPQRQEEVLAASGARSQAQPVNYDFYRQAESESQQTCYPTG